MTRFEIFDEVVDIMANDSATCKDITGADPTPFRAGITEEMSDADFANLVNEYLCSFGLTGHLDFYTYDQAENLFTPFRVRRYDDKLYVTYGRKGSGVEKGDIITHLDGLTITEAAEKYSFMFSEKNPDRQAEIWKYIMKRYVSQFTVHHKSDGETETLKYQPFTDDDTECEEQQFHLKKLSKDTAVIRLPDFMTDKPIKNIVKQNKRFLRKCRYLIFDVRGNSGGSDINYVPLEPYCFPKGKAKYDMSEMSQERLFTERGCKLRAEFFRSLKDAFSEEMVEKFAREQEEKAGKGWVKYDCGSFTVKGKRKPEKVFVITDDACGSSGDSFVYEMALSPKVTVVGRNTRGILDYSNLVERNYGTFRFRFPQSRLCCIDSGIRYMGKGYPVDIYIPWTPEHLEHDVDLETVLTMIESNKKSRK